MLSKINEQTYELTHTSNFFLNADMKLYSNAKNRNYASVHLPVHLFLPLIDILQLNRQLWIYFPDLFWFISA